MYLVAIEPLRHDGAPIAPGDTFACEQEAAEQLIAAEAAKLVDDERPETTPTPSKRQRKT